MELRPVMNCCACLSARVRQRWSRHGAAISVAHALPHG
jgi:hypothetical protein